MKRAVFFFWSLTALGWGSDFFGPSQSVKGTLVIPGRKAFSSVYAAALTVRSEPNKINGSLYALGSNLALESDVAHNAHLCGEEVWFRGLVSGDLIEAGGSLHLSPRANIGGDLVAAGLNVDMDGQVRGKAWIVGKRVDLNGTVEGKAVVRYDQALVLGPSCRLKDKLICYGPDPPLVEAGATVAQIDYRPKESIALGLSRLSRWSSVFGWPALIRLVAWLIAAWVLGSFIPGRLELSMAFLAEHPWKGLSRGLLISAGAFLSVPLLLLTLVGAYLSILTVFLYLSALLVSRLVGVFYLGSLLRRSLEGNKKTVLPFRWTASAVLLLHLLELAPLARCLLVAGLTLMALGSLMEPSKPKGRRTTAVRS